MTRDVWFHQMSVRCSLEESPSIRHVRRSDRHLLTSFCRGIAVRRVRRGITVRPFAEKDRRSFASQRGIAVRSIVEGRPSPSLAHLAEGIADRSLPEGRLTSRRKKACREQSAAQKIAEDLVIFPN